MYLYVAYATIHVHRFICAILALVFFLSQCKEISVIKADLTFQVNNSDFYHFECEITYDGQITIRMLEYDLHAALAFRTDAKSTQLTHEYRVPTVKVQSYSLEEIKEKHLCLLIPFLLIRFRRNIPSDREIRASDSPTKQNNLMIKVQKSKEELTSFFDETILILDKEIADGFLTEVDKKLILWLLQKSLLRISYHNKELCQEVYDMTEPTLKLPTDELFEVIHENDALKRACDKKDAEIADKDAMLANQSAMLAQYKRLYGEL